MTREQKGAFLVGAHTSSAGGAYKALLRGKEIGANTIQLFTNNQKTWHSSPISEEAIALWNEAKEETGIDVVMSHDSYLINLGSCKEDLLKKSRTAFANELKRCHLFDITYLNFHPGAATEGSVEECLNTIVKSLLQLKHEAAKGKTRLLLETTAGQGTSVGASFEELAYIIREVEGEIPIGVCIDTCHIFSAGYDIRTHEGWEEVLAQFKKTIGLKHLYAMHLNDSMKPFGARKDRHAELGKGEIGLESFKVTMTHPSLAHLPKYLETPSPEKWPEEIKLLQGFAHAKR